MNYWNSTGRFQSEYDEMVNVGFAFTNKEKKAMHKYYRYYNDGDLPMGARYAWTHDVEGYLEKQADIAVAKAYVRFKDGNVSVKIKFYAKKTFVGFSNYVVNA